MYVFLSHQSACEALRQLQDSALALPAWPPKPRRLPRYGDCISTQSAFAHFRAGTELSLLRACQNPVHMLVPHAGYRSRGKSAAFHVWQQDIPASAMLRADESLFVSTPSFVLVQMAMVNFKADPLIDAFVEESRSAESVASDGPIPYDDPFEWGRKERLIDMALVACEFAGSYRLPTGVRDTAYRLAPLMTCQQTREFAARIRKPYGTNRLHAALDLAFDRSASPMETALALMLCLPVEMGGYGLARPELNKPLSVEGFSSLWDGGMTVTPDLLWEGRRLVIEYESDEFHASLGKRKAAADATRANVLMAMGYAVLRATTATICSLSSLEQLARQVALHLGTEIPPTDDVTNIRRHKLHRILMDQGRDSGRLTHT